MFSSPEQCLSLPTSHEEPERKTPLIPYSTEGWNSSVGSGQPQAKCSVRLWCSLRADCAHVFLNMTPVPHGKTHELRGWSRKDRLSLLPSPSLPLVKPCQWPRCLLPRREPRSPALPTALVISLFRVSWKSHEEVGQSGRPHW